MDDERTRMLEEIARRRGYVHDFHKTLIMEDLDFFKLYEKMSSLVYVQERTLSRKVKELVFTGVLVAMRASREHIKLHIRAALEHGASKEEILEAIEVAYLPSGVVSLMEGLDAYKEVMAQRSGRDV
jgi:4-carboxymuconolactone decarboxylase